MPSALCVTAPLLLAAVLVVSAVGKLQAPERARAAFTTMGVPSWLDRPTIAAAHPWAEIAIAAALLIVPSPFGVVVAVAALLLMLGYVVLVVRAFRSPVDVDCACFGAFGGERVTAGTLWRNAWLTALAGISVWCAVGGRTVIGRIADLDSASGWWLGSVVATIVTAGLVLGSGRGQGGSEVTVSAGLENLLEDGGDYIRSRTPAVPLTMADGTTKTLRELSARRAQLLVFVSEWCGACRDVIEAIPRWREELAQIDVRVVTRTEPSKSALASTEAPMSAHDVHGWAAQSLGTISTPSAVLVGADGLLAGGPVIGSEGVPDFVDEIREQLTR